MALLRRHTRTRREPPRQDKPRLRAEGPCARSRPAQFPKPEARHEARGDACAASARSLEIHIDIQAHAPREHSPLRRGKGGGPRGIPALGVFRGRKCHHLGRLSHHEGPASRSRLRDDPRYGL